MSSGFVRVVSAYPVAAGASSVLTLHVLRFGLPEDISSVSQSVYNILMPLSVSQGVVKLSSYFFGANTYVKVGMTLASIAVSITQSQKGNTEAKDISEIASNIVHDNSDALSIGTLTFTAITGLGLATTTPALLVSAAVAGVTVTGGAIYKHGVPSSSLYDFVDDLTSEHLGHLSDGLQCLGDVIIAEQ